MSKDVLRCDSLQFSLHNLQNSLSRYNKNSSKTGLCFLFDTIPPFNSMAEAGGIVPASVMQGLSASAQ